MTKSCGKKHNSFDYVGYYKKMSINSFVSKLPVRLQGVLLLLLAPLAVYFGFYRPLLQAQRGDEVVRLAIAPAIALLPVLFYGLNYLLLGKKGYDFFYASDGKMTKANWIVLIGGMTTGAAAHYILVRSEIANLGYR